MIGPSNPGLGVPREELLEAEEVTFRVKSYCEPTLILHLKPAASFGNIIKPDKLLESCVGVARLPEGNAVIAYSEDNTIAGYILMAPPAPILFQSRLIHRRWERCAAIYEFGSIEVAEEFRGLGIARKLLEVAFSDPGLEDRVVVATGVVWHWDVKGEDAKAWEYRRFLMDLLREFSFKEYYTTDPEVTEHPANFLMARVGSRVIPLHVGHFHQILYRVGE